MNAWVNVDCTGLPEDQGVVLNAEVNLLYGPKEKWYSLPPIFATIPAVHGASICGICVNDVIFGMTCIFTSNIAENGGSEKLDK